jgi:hypothetical protein
VYNVTVLLHASINPRVHWNSHWPIERFVRACFHIGMESSSAALHYWQDTHSLILLLEARLHSLFIDHSSPVSTVDSTGGCWCARWHVHAVELVGPAQTTRMVSAQWTKSAPLEPQLSTKVMQRHVQPSLLACLELISCPFLIDLNSTFWFNLGLFLCSLVWSYYDPCFRYTPVDVLSSSGCFQSTLE